MKVTPIKNLETFSMQSAADCLEEDPKSARSIYMAQFQRGWNAASKGHEPKKMTEAEWDGYYQYLEECGDFAS